MRREAAIDRFLQLAGPGLVIDQQVTESLLDTTPPLEQVLPLLADPRVETARAAVIYLALYGSFRETPVLALCLQHRDAGVARLAEHSLWHLWMQAGTDTGNRLLADAILLSKSNRQEEALDLLTLLTEREPAFAEAHFQRGLVLGLLGRNAEAAVSYREALRHNPYHFAAAASLGHAALERGRLPEAVEHYRQALRLNPRLEDIPAVLHEVESALAQLESR